MAMHKPGDLVWAKMKGFPPWPAMVLSTSDVNSPTPNGRQPVLFYGTQETAFMKPTELYAYRQFRDQYEVPRKLKGFNQGIREIRMEAGIEEDDDMDAKFPVIGAATPVKSGTMDTRADKISTPSSIPSSSDSDFGQMMRPISDTTLKVFSAASSPSPAEDMLQSVPKLKISFGGMEPIVSTPTALETEATPSMTSSGRVRRPSTKFSPDDYYSMPMDRPKKQQTPVEAKVIKTEVTSSSSNKPSTSGAFSAGKIKFKSMKRKEEREHKKTPEPPSFLFEPIKPEKRPRADSSLRDASKPKRVKRVSISDKISFEPFFSSLPPLTSEAFDICIPSSSSNIVSTMDPTLLSPMLTSAAVPLCDRDDSGNGPLLEPSLVGESSLRHSRRTPKPKSFDDFVTSTKGSGRERASDSISGGLSSVMMRSPARSRGLSISSTRTRLTSGNSDVFEEIGLSIEPLSGFSAADLVSAQAAGYQTIETDDGMSEGSGRDVATPEEPLPMPAPLKLCVECGCECRVVTAHDGSMKWRCTSKYCMKWNGKYEAFSLDTPSSADEKSSKGGRSRSSPRRSGSGTPQRYPGSTARSGVRSITESSEESLEDAETEAYRRMQWLASLKEVKPPKKKEPKPAPPPPPPPVNTTTPTAPRRSASGRPKSYKVEMTPPVSASGQRHCTYCNGQVRPQMCGGNKHRWRCVDKKCRKWYGWVRSNEEIPKDLGKKGRWKDLALKIKRKRLSSSISVETAAAASASVKKIAKAAAAKVKAAMEDKPKRPIGRPPKQASAGGGLKIKLKTMRRPSIPASGGIKQETADDAAPKLTVIEHDPHVVANLRLNDSIDSVGSDIQAELDERARILHGGDYDRQSGVGAHNSRTMEEHKQKRKYTKRKNIDGKPSNESLKPPKPNKSPSKGLRLVTGIQQVPSERPVLQEPTGMFAEDIAPAISGRPPHRSSYEDLPRDPSPLPEKALHYRMTLVEQKSRWWTSQKARRKSPSPRRTFGTETLDCAASFRIIGRTLGALGERLHNRIIDGPPPNETLAVDDSNGAVAGTLDMMMDSLMASFGPLMALTKTIPQLDAALDDDTLQIVWEASAVHTPIPQ